jgi:predicted unusual protein kinase regulating ubiquinone biosynthesis (AarF/ABC1/UbiB family)
LRLGKLGLSLTGSYLSYQVQNAFLGENERLEKQRQFRHAASRRLRTELEALKGPAMKLGQLLSTQTHALPDEAIQELAHLQMRAPGMHPTLARAQFKSALGKYPEEVFDRFEEEPCAAASLGQVHRAVTRQGDRVAVKIQYPAIRSAIENDFKLLRSALLPGRVSGHIPVAVIDEIHRGFSEETDYLREGKNIDFFRERLAHFSFLSVPSVHWNLTTDRVLTMSLLDGVGVQDFLARKPSQGIRDLVGWRLLELYYFQVFQLQVLHADPHPGNYLLGLEGRIGLVDFGCVKQLSMDLADLSRCCLERSWQSGEKDAERVIHMIWGRKVPFEQARTMLGYLQEAVDVLFPKAGRNGTVVDFGKPELLRLYGRNLRNALRHRLTNPEFAFLSRTELGLYGLLHQLRARVDTREVLNAVGLGC